MTRVKGIANVPGQYTFECLGCKCHHAFWTSHPDGRKQPIWTFNGDREKPTVSPSLLVQTPQWVPPVTSENLEEWKRNPWEQKQVIHICHSFIRDGKIQYLEDCTHELAGQTIDLPNLE